MAALLLWVGRADAGRRRIVVLDFEGPKAEKFHADVVKLIKKGHTVLSVDKWNDKADELGASSVTDKNIKKVAKKLRIDGVVTGKIEKRRDEYIIRLKLRSGTTGEVIGSQVQTKAEGTRLDAQAQRDIKDELIAAFDDLDSNRDSDDEEEEEEAEEEEGSKKKSGFGKKGQMDDEEAEEEEDPKAAKKRKAEEEKKRKAEEQEAKRLAKEEEARKKDEEKRKKDDEKKKKADEAAALATKAAAEKRKAEEEEEDEEEETSKKRASSSDEEEDEDGDRKARKRRASSDDEDEDSIEESADTDSGDGRDLSPAGRAFDVVAGMSFVARTLKFEYQSDLGKPPPGYKQTVPVAGGMIDMTVYPMSFSKSSKGIIRGIGLNVMYDQVLVINSQKRYADAMGVQQIANLKTTENRWAVGPVLRYPMGKIVLGGSLTYGKQQFTVAQTLPNDEPTDIPNVNYTMFTPAAFVKYPVTPKITVNGELAFHAITNTGQIQSSGMAGYGAATVTGFELEAGGDYMVKKNIFARASLRYESIGIKFKGDPTSQSNMRDTDPEQDVSGAKDTYLGGSITVGYVY